MVDRIARAINAIKALLAVLGWLGLSGWLAGLAATLGGGAWAMMTGIAAPLVIMAAFCTFTAAAYLAMIPLGYRVLLRAQDMPGQAHSNPEIWRHVTQVR